jgi:anti-anti-sigma regulatory factor
MWSVEVNRSRNLLQIAFAGRVDLAEAHQCAERVRELLKDLPPGFCLLTDLSRLEEMDVACGKVIDPLMDELDCHGIQKIVRVVPEPRKDIGFGIMSLFHYRPQVHVITCQTLEEARSHLP